jgi:hypothetical protein
MNLNTAVENNCKVNFIKLFERSVHWIRIATIAKSFKYDKKL